MFTAAIPAAADLPARKLHGIVHTAAFKPLNPIMTQAKPKSSTMDVAEIPATTNPVVVSQTRNDDVQVSLARSIRMHAIQQHGHCAQDSENGDHESYPRCIEAGHLLNDGGRDKGVAIVSDVDAQQEDTEHPYASLAQRITDFAACVNATGGGIVAAKCCEQPAALFVVQPCCRVRSVRQAQEKDHAENNGGQPLNKKEPLPPCQAPASLQMQQGPGH